MQTGRINQIEVKATKNSCMKNCLQNFLKHQFEQEKVALFVNLSESS
jgi:hypothetical protein